MTSPTSPLPEVIASLEALLVRWGGPGPGYVQAARSLSPLARVMYLKEKKDLLERKTRAALTFLHVPFTPEEFFRRSDAMDAERVLWPRVLDALIELNDWVYDPQRGVCGRYTEAVLTGAIGSAKSTVALYTMAYQTHLLACLRSPHEMWDLDPQSEIVMILQSATGALAQDVDFNRLRSMLSVAPWFQKHFLFSKYHTSRMRFPRRIEIKPVSSSETAALSQNVIGGVIDEMNFMAYVEKSRRAGGNETYDQAEQLYSAISRRRTSRFMKLGWVPGMLCLVSSTRYPGEFTERKLAEAKSNSRIYVYNKRHWDVAPEGTYSGRTFSLYLGDGVREARILPEGVQPVPEEEPRTIAVPVEVRHEFERDLYGSLRDVAGVSTRALNPYLHDLSPLHEALGRVPSVFGCEWTDFETRPCTILPENFRNPKAFRFAHIDLGLSSDSCGLAVCHVDRFLRVRRGEKSEEVVPRVIFDGVLEIRPPPGREIIFEKVRAVLYRLREMGMPLRWVTYDSWQSKDSLQLLAQKGFQVGEQSVDRSTVPYDYLRSALHDRRVYLPTHEKVKHELVHLERTFTPGKDRVDHPPGGSKDCADAVAAALFGITRRREVWAAHGVLSRLYRRAHEAPVSERDESGPVPARRSGRLGRRGFTAG